MLTRFLDRATVLFYVALILAPSLAFLFGADIARVDEKRRLADWPELAWKSDSILQLPSGLDAYANDHFGLRDALVMAHSIIRVRLIGDSSSSQIEMGSNGFIYLSETDPQDSSRGVFSRACSQVADPSDRDAFANHIDRLSNEFPGTAVSMIFVPTKSTIYSEYLPSSIDAETRNGCREGSELLRWASQATALNERVRVIYPHSLFSELKTRISVYEPKNFHWIGTTPFQFARWLFTDVYHLPGRYDVPIYPSVQVSDIDHLLGNPGIEVEYDYHNYREIGAEFCYGIECLENSSLRVSGYNLATNPAIDQGKAVLITDSFGFALFESLTMGFSEIHHFEINGLPSDQIVELFEWVADIRADHIIFVFHDAASESKMAWLASAYPSTVSAGPPNVNE